MPECIKIDTSCPPYTNFTAVGARPQDLWRGQPQRERNCSGVEALHVRGAKPRLNEGHRVLRCCGDRIALEALSEGGKGWAQPPGEGILQGFSSPLAYYVQVQGVGAAGAVLLWIRS